MEKLKEENIILGKYQDTDIDEYSLFFSHNMESSLVDEFEIPDDYEYMVLTGTREGMEFPDWINVVNPKGLREIIMKDDKCLPGIRFEFKGEEKTLIDFFRKDIFNII